MSLLIKFYRLSRRAGPAFMPGPAPVPGGGPGRTRRLYTLCAAACLLFSACLAGAADVTVAVVSSEGGAYLEAFSAFKTAYGSEVKYYDASKGAPGIPPGTKNVVAFGARAAGQKYPSWVNVVYCMAPGFVLEAQGREGRTVMISAVPGFGTILSKLKELQPSLTRLWVFWIQPEFGPYLEAGKAKGAELGIEVTAIKSENISKLPGLLRRGLTEMDAFWLPPDPRLISSESLMILRDFSWANSIPFYAPTMGLALKGATASVGISFAEMGAAAAKAVKTIQADGATAPVIFPDKVELTINRSAAEKCRLKISPEVLLRADHLLP